MPRTFVADIQPQMQIDEVYRIVDRQLRANRQGNLYLLLQLQDKSGTISAMRWNADEKLAERFTKGSYVRVHGTSQLHNGTMQLIVTQLQTVDEATIALEDFDSVIRVDVESLWQEIGGMLQQIQNESLKAIGLAFYRDPRIEAGLRCAPAGVKAHHAYPGGLIEHVVSLMKLAKILCSHYGELDPSVMVIGAFLHDIGKIDEIAFDGELGYTDPGQLLGHLVQGIQMLDRKVEELRSSGISVDPEALLQVQHIVVSHHGHLEHGSPKVPMTLEAIAFHYLDELDAKLSSARMLIESDRTKDRWTTYNPTLGRKVLKPNSNS